MAIKIFKIKERAVIYKLNDKTPVIGENNYIAPNATVIGDVTLASNVSIWFGINGGIRF